MNARSLTTEGFCRLFIEPFEAAYILCVGPQKKTVKIRWVRGEESFPGLSMTTNVWMGPVARNPDTWTDSSTGAGNAALLRAHDLWIDFDYVTREDAAERCRKAGLPEPSVVVSSGHGFHHHWLLKEPAEASTIEALERYERVLRGITIAANGDRNVSKAAQVLRLPGTMNMKCVSDGAKCGHGEPQRCEIVGGDLKRYSFEDFLKFSDKPKPVISDTRSGAPNISDNPISRGQALSILEVLGPVYVEGLRNGLSLAISGLCRKKGVPEDQTTRLLSLLQQTYGGSDHTRSARETYDRPLEAIAVWRWISFSEPAIEAVKEAARIIGRGEVDEDPPPCRFCQQSKHGKCRKAVCPCTCSEPTAKRPKGSNTRKPVPD